MTMARNGGGDVVDDDGDSHGDDYDDDVSGTCSLYQTMIDSDGDYDGDDVGADDGVVAGDDDEGDAAWGVSFFAAAGVELEPGGGGRDAVMA